MSIIFYVLDTETTGLKTGWHEINQISVLNSASKDQITIDICVDYPERASKEALEVQGKSVHDLDNGISLKDAVIQVNEFFQKDNSNKAARCIVAHNAPFDRKFCHSAWDSVELEFPADLWICTKQLAQRYVKKYGGEKIAQAQSSPKPKFGLNNFLQGVGITPKLGAHRADTDTINTLELFNWLLNSQTEYVSLIERIPHKKENVKDLLDSY